MDKTPHEKPKPKKAKPREKGSPPLKEQGDLDLEVKTPFLWILLLAVPIVFGLLVSFRDDPPPPTFDPPAPLVENKSPAPDRTLAKERGSSRRYNPGSLPAGDGTPVACDFSPWVGLRVDQTMIEALRRSNRPFRELPPGAMMTMDHAPARVNFDLDANGVITRVWCG
jgi:hypothetical protein